ncbi:MAG: hypothetical protein Q9206_004591 [Seirophora lacunosa]
MSFAFISKKTAGSNQMMQGQKSRGNTQDLTSGPRLVVCDLKNISSLLALILDALLGPFHLAHQALRPPDALAALPSHSPAPTETPAWVSPSLARELLQMLPQTYRSASGSPPTGSCIKITHCLWRRDRAGKPRASSKSLQRIIVTTLFYFSTTIAKIGSQYTPSSPLTVDHTYVVGNNVYKVRMAERKCESLQTLVPTRPVGYAFVDLSTADEAQKAIAELSGKGSEASHIHDRYHHATIPSLPQAQHSPSS